MPDIEQAAPSSRFLWLADHPALDLLNTLPRLNGELVDLLKSDADVLEWLLSAEISSVRAQSAPPGSLLQAARRLRATVRELVERHKAGERADVSTMNAFLAEAQSYPQLVADRAGGWKIERVRQERTPEQILGPFAEAAADLLTTVDFDLVRRCEDESCVLWFYDQTKSHHRRWCSMAACGNRHKVAAYRRRRLEGSTHRA